MTAMDGGNACEMHDAGVVHATKTLSTGMWCMPIPKVGALGDAGAIIGLSQTGNYP